MTREKELEECLRSIERLAPRLDQSYKTSHEDFLLVIDSVRKVLDMEVDDERL